MEERLQKVMAHRGIGSRRHCEEMIRDGRVQVNGELAGLGQKVDPATDKIVVDGKPLGPGETLRYFVLNKPYGYITTSKDQFGRKSVLDLLPPVKERVYPVGRLDYDSEGLVFLTNDGDLAYRLTHPSYEVPKTYIVAVEGNITMDAVYRLRTGVILEDGRTSPAEVNVLKPVSTGSVLQMTIREGRNRQLRRMCEKLGFNVVRLRRTKIGPLSLGKLPLGAARRLTFQEINDLYRAVGL
ncbi:MAG: pseudouridine synthase [Bacillota bacterium]|nr:pseudouridine synthase [Bacillota bacterium]HHT91495.1 rRNA pseudouridine synthase [Bacillota bacterium]